MPHFDEFYKIFHRKYIRAGLFTAVPQSTKVQVIDSKKYNTYNVRSV